MSCRRCHTQPIRGTYGYESVKRSGLCNECAIKRKVPEGWTNRLDELGKRNNEPYHYPPIRVPGRWYESSKV